MSATGEPRKPCWAKCASCGHVWTLAYIPMELGLFARVCGAARCPMCGVGSKQLRIAEQVDGVLKEAGG